MNWSYVAGFFDGEGSIVITGTSCKLTLAQNSREVLDQIQDFIESEGIDHSWITITTPRPWQRQPNTCYHLAFSKARNVRLFLHQVMPHLIVKKEDAVKALRSIVYTKETFPITDKNKRQAKELLAQGKTYRTVCKELGRNMPFGLLRELKDSIT